MCLSTSALFVRFLRLCSDGRCPRGRGTSGKWLSFGAAPATRPRRDVQDVRDALQLGGGLCSLKEMKRCRFVRQLFTRDFFIAGLPAGTNDECHSKLSTAAFASPQESTSRRVEEWVTSSWNGDIVPHTCLPELGRRRWPHRQETTWH